MSTPEHFTTPEQYAQYRRCLGKVRPGWWVSIWMTNLNIAARTYVIRHHLSEPVRVAARATTQNSVQLILGSPEPEVLSIHRRFWSASAIAREGFDYLDGWEKSLPYQWMVYDFELCIGKIIRA